MFFATSPFVSLDILQQFQNSAPGSAPWSLMDIGIQETLCCQMCLLNQPEINHWSVIIIFNNLKWDRRRPQLTSSVSGNLSLWCSMNFFFNAQWCFGSCSDLYFSMSQFCECVIFLWCNVNINIINISISTKNDSNNKLNL